MDKVKVTALSQTYTRDGQRFGPFAASKDTPYLEVPVAIAMASGAPEYTGEEVATEPAQGTDQPQQVAALTTERDSLQQKLDALQGEYDRFKAAADTAGAEGTTARVALERQVEGLKGEVTTLTTERDAARQAVTDGKLIPEDAMARLIAVPGIAKALAEKALTALTAPAEAPEK